MVGEEEEKMPERVRGRPFAKGRSGNPACSGPLGSRNKATMAARMLLAGEAEALTRKAVELALTGDPTALRLCLERILPARPRGRVCAAADPECGRCRRSDGRGDRRTRPRHRHAGRGRGHRPGGHDLCANYRDQRFRQAAADIRSRAG